MSQIREGADGSVSDETTEPTISTTETAPEGGKGNEATGGLSEVNGDGKASPKGQGPRNVSGTTPKRPTGRFAGDRAQLMKEAAEDLHYEAVMKAKLQAEKEKKNSIEEAAMMNMALHQVDEYVLATHLEFPTSQQDQEI